MFTHSGFLSTQPGYLGSEEPRPTTLAQLIKATEVLKAQPIITLATAIEQLGLLNPREIEMLMDEDPQLLRSRSPELVERLLMTTEDLHHALARTAGIVEVDAANFLLPDWAFDAPPRPAVFGGSRRDAVNGELVSDGREHAYPPADADQPQCAHGLG